jgi:hypothetical protein
MPPPGRYRLTLIALLLASTAAFLVGVLAERTSDDEHKGSVAVVHREEAEGAHSEGAEAGEGKPAGGDEHRAEARLLGIDPESTPLLVIAVGVGLALAALTASWVGASRAFLVLVAVAALAWAVLDIREIAHQIDESRSGIAAIAAAVAALHLATAAIATVLARSPRLSDASSKRPTSSSSPTGASPPPGASRTRAGA